MHFTFAHYLHDRRVQLGVLLFSDLLLAGALAVLGLSVQPTALCLGIALLGQAAACIIGYLRQRRFFAEALALAEQAEKAAELVALLPEAATLEARSAAVLADAVALAASDELAAERASARATQEYVELWTHEVKAPIAAARLALAECHGEAAERISLSLDRIEARVQQALYLARASAIATDYAIREVELAALVREAVKRNAGLLIDAGVRPKVDLPLVLTVYTDPQWTGFILDQLITNSAKYGAKRIAFSASVPQEGSAATRVTLLVADDGWGISDADASRVFERAYTGENGRRAGTSTGMGLYLVATLAERMGVGVTLDTEEGKGTTVELAFPVNRTLTPS